VQQLEQEVKLEVEPEWSLPDLTGLFPGVAAVALPVLSLDAVYYDTADTRLARHHITLRFRREVAAGHVEGTWTVKLPSSAPSDGTVLVRTEVTWPGAEPGDGGETVTSARPRVRRRPSANPVHLPPHPEAARFLRAMTLGRPLAPVAEVKTVRERTELRTSDGRSLAEIDRDSVTGRALPPSGDGASGGSGGSGTAGTDGTDGTDGTAGTAGSVADQEVRFVEVEIELAEGSSQEVLDAVAHRLCLAGARPSARKSKVATVLQMAAAARGPQAGPDAPAGREVAAPALNGEGAPGGPGRTARRAHALMSDALAEQAGECLGTLQDHDPALRLSDPDPEHVHQSRVGVRRLRSIMRSFAPLVTTPLGEVDDSTEIWFEDLRDELKWLGGALGAVRDTDVRLQGLVQECSTLPHADNMGAATLLAVAEDEQRQAHDALLEAMATERYVAILRTLEGLASRPPPPSVEVPDGQVPDGDVTGARSLDGPLPTGLWGALDRPASAGLPALARRQWRAVRKAVRKLGDEPPDTALHRVRIQAKRLRYLSDVAALFATPAANRVAAKATSKATAHLQDVLGELHDASVTEQWLRDAPNRLPSATKTAVVFAAGLAAGELAARAQERQRALRKKWPAAWAPVQSQKLRRWMTP